MADAQENKNAQHQSVNDPNRIEDGWQPGNMTRFRKFVHRFFGVIAIILGFFIIIWSSTYIYYNWRISNKLDAYKESGFLKEFKDFLPPPVPIEKNAFPIIDRVEKKASDYNFKIESHTIDKMIRYLNSDEEKRLEDNKYLPVVYQNLSESDLTDTVIKLTFSETRCELWSESVSALDYPEYDPFVDRDKRVETAISFYNYGPLYSRIYIILQRVSLIKYIDDPVLSESIIISSIALIDKTTGLFGIDFSSYFWINRCTEAMRQSLERKDYSEDRILRILKAFQAVSNRRIRELQPTLIRSAQHRVFYYKEIIDDYRKDKQTVSYYGSIGWSCPDVVSSYLLAPLCFHSLDVLLQTSNETYTNIVELSPIESLLKNDALIESLKPYTQFRFEPSMIGLIYSMNSDHFTYIMTLNRINMEVIGLALEIHFIRYGDYPDSLNELSPDILDVIPSDLLTDKQFTYIKTDSEIIIKTEFDFTSLNIHPWYSNYEKEAIRKLKRKPARAPNKASDITPNQ